MMQQLTRARLIQIWFTAVALIAVAAIAMGTSITAMTGIVLLALSAVPAIMVMMLWPGIQPPTVGDVLRGTDRRS
jgi:hypothetical protein